MDNRTITQVRNNETKLINEIKILEIKLKKQKEIIDKATGFIKTNCSKVGKEYKLLTGNVDYLLSILEDKEVKE